MRIEKADSFAWISDKLHEIGIIVDAFSELTNVEFTRSRGAPGVAGSDVDIVSTCRLYGELCGSTLAWEESVRFSRVDDGFTEVRDLYVGVAGALIDQAERIPGFLTDTLASRPTSGSYELVLTGSLPDGWVDAVNAAMRRAVRALRN